MVVIAEEALTPTALPPPAPAVVETDERAARRTLRDQIARLEHQLAATFVAAYPRCGVDVSVGSLAGPRMLGLGELEATRDRLADRLRIARVALADRADLEEGYRLLVERMLLEPGKYKWVRVTGDQVGEATCKQWHVRPRLGLVGMLMGWWRVKVSSGCPLAG